MASVRPHTSRKGVTTYSVLYRDQGKQRSVTLTDLSRAEELAQLMGMIGVEKALAATFDEAEEEADDDAPAAPTLAQYLDQHIEESTSASSATKGNYRRYVATLRDGIGALQLDEVTKADVRRWVKGLQSAGKTGKTVKNHLAFVAGVLNGAVEDGDLHKNPCHGVSVGDSSRTIQPVFLTAQQVRTIAEACAPYEGLVMWLAGTGMRWSEATALHVSDVDVAAGTARVTQAWKRQYGENRGDGMRLGPPKSKKSVRTVNVAADLLAAIETELGRAPGELLFQSTVGTRVNIDVFRSTYWTPAVKSMVPRPRIHDLRHTCASLMIKAGVPLTTVQAHLGHESIKTTSDIYGHLDREAGQRAAAAIAAAFAEQPGE